MKNYSNAAPVIAIVGMCGAGKSSVASLLKVHGYEGVYFGGITIAAVKERGLPLTPENEKSIREHLRAKEGMAVFAKRSLPLIEKLLLKSKLVYIDGLYSYEELLFLKENLADRLILLEVYAHKYLRKERLANREIRPLTPEETDERDRMEIEKLHKAPPIALSDYKIDNSDGKVELEMRFAKLLSLLQSKAKNQ